MKTVIHWAESVLEYRGKGKRKKHPKVYLRVCDKEAGRNASRWVKKVNCVKCKERASARGYL